MADNRRKWCLIGVPDHQGVQNLGGRVGAAYGPEAFRKLLRRLNGRDRILEALQEDLNVSGLGLDVAANLETTAKQIAECRPRAELSVIVGGGHDHGYSHLLGISQATDAPKKMGCINIDAHLDVRKPEPVIMSGSPFYLALESGLLDPKRFVEFGIQSHCNAPELWDFIESHPVEIVPFERLRNGKAVSEFQSSLKMLSKKCDEIVVSFDLDAVSEDSAPGVSAPQAEGLNSSEVVQMMELAGSHPKVRSLGIFELNPEHDVDSRTARLAATCAYHFVSYGLKRSN